MLCSKRWLDSLIKIEDTHKGFADNMTMSGSKVEGWETEGEGIKGVLVGQVLSISPHPSADNLLKLCVDIGGGELSILTAAKNLKVGDKIPIAPPGATLAGGVKISKRTMQGEVSDGMACSLAELGLHHGDFPYADPDGIFVLQEPGEPGEDICKVIGLDDTVFEFEITSNRPDCLSMIGLAREAAATYGLAFERTLPKVRGSEGNISDFVSVEVKNPDLCLRYVAKAVKNVKVAPSPRWMRERLRAAGMRPINNIVDITNYVMLEYGQPLHAFNYDELPQGKIIVRNAQEGEKLTTLDGVERTLTPDMLMICDANRPTGIAGVMGGLGSGIVDSTNCVVFESAAFDKVSIRLTSRKLGLRSESSSRFEKGLDAQLCMDAALRACELVELLGCGEVVGGVIDVNHTDYQPTTLPLRCDWINGHLGTDIPAERMESILRGLGFKVDNGTITVPSYRGDVEMDADISEEIARIYGYNNIPSTSIRGSAAGALTPRQLFDRDIAVKLTGFGLSEILTYTFISPGAYDRIGIPTGSEQRRSVVVTNPLGEETSLMRCTALPSMMDVLARNFKNRNPSAYLYEIAKVFHPLGSADELPIEEYRLTIGLYDTQASYFTLKGIVEAIMLSLRIDRRSISYEAVSDNPTFHPGRCADIAVCGRQIGLLGEVHPAVAEAYGIEGRCYMADLSMDLLFEYTPPEIIYKPMPRYPASLRDIALVCDSALPVQSLERAIWSAAPDILEAVTLFDIYEGSQVEPGKKSVAYSLSMRSPEGTLVDEQVDAAVKSVLEALGALGAVIRS